MAKAQARYKQDFNVQVQGNIPTIRTDHYVFLREKYHNPQEEKGHKLSSITDGPYRVVTADYSGSKVILDIKGEHERISGDRVVLAPRSLSDVTTPPDYLGGPRTKRVTPYSTAEISKPPIPPIPTRVLTNLPGAAVSLSAVMRLAPPSYVFALLPAAKDGKVAPLGTATDAPSTEAPVNFPAHGGIQKARETTIQDANWAAAMSADHTVRLNRLGSITPVAEQQNVSTADSPTGIEPGIGNADRGHYGGEATSAEQGRLEPTETPKRDVELSLQLQSQYRTRNPPTRALDGVRKGGPTPLTQDQTMYNGAQS